MSDKPSPRLILETLLPHLRIAAGYAHQIQSRIATQPSKEQGDNFFAAALTDANISIQNLVEIALLANFPQIRFYGEEYESSVNTKYFRSIDLGEEGDYLVTLDPIDGTQFYLDGYANYQIIVSVVNRDDFEAVLAIYPALNSYFYALRNQGTFKGSLTDDLDACVPLEIKNPQPTVYLGWQMR
ncbi:MAG: inositol monophosphatase family protein, partial [Moorea sp. SIO2B7]|nr:inositol monophosphatase family protein [Moorena sp. SIO2B7]